MSVQAATIRRLVALRPVAVALVAVMLVAPVTVLPAVAELEEVNRLAVVRMTLMVLDQRALPEPRPSPAQGAGDVLLMTEEAPILMGRGQASRTTETCPSAFHGSRVTLAPFVTT